MKTATFQLGVKLKKMHWVELKRFINTVKNHKLVFPELMSLGEWREVRREDSGAQMVGVRSRSGRIQMCKHLGVHGPEAEWKPRI